MKYISTRGGGQPKSFEEVILTGLAPDGGLYVPEQLPQFSRQEIASWSKPVITNGFWNYFTARH